MVRTLKLFAVALVCLCATIVPLQAFAQIGGATPTATPNATTAANSTATISATTSPTSTLTTSNASITATTAISSQVGSAPTATTTIPSVQLVPTATIVPSTSTSASVATTLTSTATAEATPGPLQGTILANRSDTLAVFFLEGQTYELAAGQSQGFDLPRPTTMVNLFNCDGSLPTTTTGCYWDPYLIQQDGFYEIYDASTNADAVQLLLRQADAPPSGQVWVQNRTGQTESVVFKEDVFDIEPTSVLELPVATGIPAILYVRNCLAIDSQSACEWAPKALDAGVYYAMLEVDSPGTQTGSTLTTIELRPVVGEVSEAAAPVSEVALAPAINCSVVVPALNVRSGPGLQYEIIGKVRSLDGSAVSVNVTGRSLDNEWLTVEPTVAEGGWINNSPSFIVCSSDVMSLPVIEAPATPVPPVAVAQPPLVTDTSVPQQPATGDAPAAEQPAAPADGVAGNTPEPDGTPAIPDGQAMLVVNNGFQHEVRFTLDQMYRTVQGPSEFDLQPGQSISILVFPGDIPFTASSPWSGLSGNASLQIDANQSATLWLRFEPEEGGTWGLHWN